MLTFRGWLSLLAAAAFFAAAPFIAPIELNVLGATVAALVLSMAAYVHLAPGPIEATRQVHPERVHVGSAARVELAVRNRGRRRSLVATAHDAVEGTEGASLMVPRLAAGESARGAYQLPTGRRGALAVGPLRLVRTDPFGLVARRAELAPAREVVIHPQVQAVAPVPETAGLDTTRAERAGSPSPHGDDFYALRPYVVGDDLRRVDWRSTARHDELVVRQEEHARQGRATVVLDVRSGGAAPSTFERMVSAAASVVAASGRRGDAVRLVTTDGTDSGFGSGPRHVGALLDRLALVQPLAATAFGPAGAVAVQERPGKPSASSALVAVVTDLGPAELSEVAALGNAFSFVAVVRLAPTSAAPAGLTVVDAGPGAPFPAAWDRVVASRGRPREQVGR